MDIVPSNTARNFSVPGHTEQHKGILDRIKGVFTGKASLDNKKNLPRPLRLSVAQRTDVGRQRQHNEDNVAYIIPKSQEMLAQKGALFIVADGMGGHAAGEVASELAVSSVTTLYYQDPDRDVASSLYRSIKYTNAAIYQRAMEQAEQNGMGTTCVAAVLMGPMAYVANVGDSRAYLIRRGRLRQITNDHSWVAEQVRAGNLTVQEARIHEMRNMITRSLGSMPDVEVDVFAERVEEGDALVLCSDGLCGMISDIEMMRIVESYPPQEAVYRLVERANAQGGSDNITVVIARVCSS